MANFIRTGNGELINLDHVEAVYPLFDGERCIIKVAYDDNSTRVLASYDTVEQAEESYRGFAQALRCGDIRAAEECLQGGEQ